MKDCTSAGLGLCSFFLKGPDASQKTAKFVHCASCFVNCQLHCLMGAVGLYQVFDSVYVLI